MDYLISSDGNNLVVEETSTLLDENNAKLLRSLEDRAIVLATAGSSDVLNAGAGCAENIVDERELVWGGSARRILWIKGKPER